MEDAVLDEMSTDDDSATKVNTLKKQIVVYHQQFFIEIYLSMQFLEYID